jgi:prepilin-type N-terminal cleavage/methylation domain-containing protein
MVIGAARAAGESAVMNTQSRVRRPRRGGGFTLIETVAVLAIVAILAAVAVPALDSLDDTRAAGAARMVLRDLTFARQHAVAVGYPAWVAFHPERGEYDLLAESAAAEGFSGAEMMTDPASGRPMTISVASHFAGAAIQSTDFDGGAIIGFDWLGRPLTQEGGDLAAAGRVVLSHGHSITVSVETGHIALEAP